MNITDEALPWVIGLGSLAGCGLGALIATALDRRRWNRLALKVFTRAPMSTTPPTTTTPPKLRPGQMEIGRRQPGDTDVFLRKGQP